MQLTQSHLAAQAAPAASAAAASDTIALNPFEVTSERDNGFQVMSVGSGSRMKIDMADTPVAYSVINREFIEALGIVDMIDAGSWATGQTFYSTDNGGHGDRVSLNVRGNQVDTSVSGNPGTQRNFYQNANQSPDSFAVESFDFGRGPNSALFGNNAATGGLAGIQSSQTKQARKGQSFTSVGFLFDQYSSVRETIDYNRPITDRIGIRLNLVNSDLRHYKIMDRQKTKGIAFNLAMELTPTTTLTLDASHEWHGSHNVGSGYDEYISGWDGATVFRGPVTNAMLSTNATVGATSTNGAASVFGINPVTGQVGLTFGGEPNGISRLGTTYVLNAADGTVMNYNNYPVTRRADSTSRVPLWSKQAPNGVYFQRASMPLQGNGSIQPSFGVGRMGMYESSRQMLPTDMMDRLILNSKWRPPSDRWQGSYDHMTNVQFSKDVQFALTQKISDHMFLDIGGDANRNYAVTNNIDDPNSAGNGFRSVTIDINQLKPDGSPNPNFLNPWSASNGPDRQNTTSDYAFRVNLGYANLNLGKWGDYTFNLQGNMSQEFNKSRSYQISLMQNADRRLWGSDVLRTRVDWGDYVHPYTEFNSVNFTNVVFDATNNNPVIAAPVKISPQRVMTAWSESFNKTRYALLQFTAKYLDNKVVLTQALRRDNNKGTTKSSLAALGSLPTDWNNSTVYYRPDAPADYFALTYVPKNTSTGAVIGAGRAQQALTRPTTTVAGLASNNPIFANDRFRNDYNNPASNVSGNTFSTGIVYRPLKWFSPQANYSNSQTPPSSTSLDMIGNVRKPVKADGYDMGFGLTFFNGKLSMKFNYFKDTRMNDSVAAPVASPINALYQANRFDDPDTTSTGRNALGFPDLPGNDYQSTRNDGREIDISANLLPGWRFTANSSWTFKVNSDRYPIAKTFVPANADSFKLLLEDAGGRLDTTQKPELAPHAPGLAVANPLPGFGLGVDTTSAVNAYNNIWINYEDVLSSRVARAPQQPTINLFNDYTIQSGVLKDLRIGAGIQWQGRVILGNYGNQTILDPNNPIPTAIDDPRVSNFDYRFMKGSYKTKFQLGYKFKNVVGNPLTLNLTIDNIVNNTRHVMGDAGLGGGTGFGGVFRQPEANLNLPNRIPSPDLISRFQDPINWSINGTYSFGGGTRGR